MLIKYRLILFLIVAGTLLIITTVTAAHSPPPPLPERAIEQLPRWPGAANAPTRPEQPAEIATDKGATYYYWSRYVYQSYQFNNWSIYRSGYDTSDYVIAPHGANDIHPRLNRGADRVVFASNREGAYEIYRINIDNSDLIRLTYTGSNNVNPAWSPGGGRIAFQSYRDGQAEIYVMNADGSNQTRLTFNDGLDGMPAWSPDGSKIAFASYRNGGYRIFVMNADGSGVTQLSNQPNSANPAWSPDGTKIAYDADLDGDGWQELWTMDVTGGNQQVVYDPPGQVDAWARSWTPDGNWVNYTLISFIYFQGNWYWVDAFLEQVFWPYGSPARFSYYGREWNPDYQTADIIPPASTIAPLPAQSTNQINVSWSGQDAGPAGMSGYDLRYKVGADGEWVYLWQNMLGTYYEFDQGIGGQTYTFQVRARDRAGNLEVWKASNQVVTTVENQPPQTAVAPLPPFTQAAQEVLLNWSGFDPGGSGVAEYQIQYRAGSGNWLDWGAATEGPVAFVGLPAGETYYFRVRGVDRAQNAPAWMGGDGNAQTTVYDAAVLGTIQDNSGTPIQGITLTTNPAALAMFNGDENGRFAAYLATFQPTYSATWAKDGYGMLPGVTLPTSSDTQLPIILPPADNLIANPHFETGSFNPAWHTGGSQLPVVTDTMRHTGQYAALLAQPAPPLLNGILIGNGNATPQILIDNNGQIIHAVWVSNNQVLYYAQRSDNSWSTPQIVATDNNLHELATQLRQDASGALHLSWQTSGGIYYAQRPSGGGWSMPQVAHLGSDVNGSQMQVTAGGVVHIAWQEAPQTDYYPDAFYKQRSGGVWSAAENLSNSHQIYTRDINLTVDAQGTAHVVWIEPAPGSFGYENVFYTRKPSGGSWSLPLNVSNQPTSFSSNPRLAVESTGVVHLVWATNAVYYARRALNGNWSTPYFVDDVYGYTYARPMLDAAQNLHILYAPNYAQRRITRYANGTWSPSTLLSPASTTDWVNIATHIDQAGWAHVIYQTWEGGPAYYSRQQSDGAWMTPVQLGHGSPPPSYYEPQIAVDAYGQPHMAWWAWTTGIYYAGPAWAETADTLTLTQFFTIPVTMSVPSLSFLYQVNAISGSPSNLAATIHDGVTETPIWSPAQDALRWQPAFVDLTPWVGQAISLTFRLEQAAGVPVAWAMLDSVTVGAAHPDVWVTAHSGNGLRGEQIVHTLTYGNRGGAMASGTRLTYTLPAELVYVSASYAPVSTSPLVWELPALPAKSSPFTLSVVVQVAPTAVSFSTLLSTAVIQSAGPELETHNNSAQGQTFIGRYAYLPLLFKQ